MCLSGDMTLLFFCRRTFSNHILQTIKDVGAFSSMHTFLVYLQMAPMEQQPAIASLLLQLDLLVCGFPLYYPQIQVRFSTCTNHRFFSLSLFQVEPRKMSIYREEAIETLIEALRRKDFSNSRIMAIDTLSSLIGRITSSGDSYLEAWLLKIAGFEQPYNVLMKAEHLKKNDTDLMETMVCISVITESFERSYSSHLTWCQY